MKHKGFPEKFWLWLFLTSVFLIFFLPAIDTDLGWHLRAGDYFLETGKLLLKNKLTILLFDHYWPQSYTFYQILTALIFRFFKFYGLSFFYALILLSSFYLIYLILEKNLYQTVSSFLLISLFSLPVFSLGWRAQLFSFLGTILVFYLLKANKILFLPLVFLFWTNFHGGFILGLIIFALYLLLQLVKLFSRKTNFKSFIKSLLVFLFSLATTLINPFGFKVWWETCLPLKVSMKKVITEWLPPMSLISLLIIVFFLPSILLIAREKKKSFWQWLLFISIFPFFYLSLTARRNVPFFFLISSLIMFGSSWFKKWHQNLNFLSFNRALIILTFAWGFFIQLPKTIIINSSWSNYCQARKSFPFPCQAVEFVQQNKIKGNFYNAYEWGGFLEWQLKDSLFFVDGRMPAWPTDSGKSPYTLYLEIIQAQPDWQKILEKYKINYLFIAQGTFLDLELKNNPNQYLWQEIYRDQKAVIYEKKEEE